MHNLKIIILYALLCIVMQGYTQTNSIIETKVLDTLETKLNSHIIQMLWLKDTIQIDVQKEQIQVDPSLIKSLRKSAKDSTLYSSKEEIDELLGVLRRGAQNCYSYALESYFEHNEAFDQIVFGKSTHIGLESAEKILDNYFQQIGLVNTKPRRNLNEPLPNDVLLSFINKNGRAIHYAYYHNGVFYSKNGSFAPTEFQSLKKFLKKSYWDTQQILLYKIDEEKVKNI